MSGRLIRVLLAVVLAAASETPQRFHVHTIVRTPNGNDHGMDLLRLHYETAPHHQKQSSHADSGRVDLRVIV